MPCACALIYFWRCCVQAGIVFAAPPPLFHKHLQLPHSKIILTPLFLKMANETHKSLKLFFTSFFKIRELVFSVRSYDPLFADQLFPGKNLLFFWNYCNLLLQFTNFFKIIFLCELTIFGGSIWLYYIKMLFCAFTFIKFHFFYLLVHTLINILPFNAIMPHVAEASLLLILW